MGRRTVAGQRVTDDQHIVPRAVQCAPRLEPDGYPVHEPTALQLERVKYERLASIVLEVGAVLVAQLHGCSIARSLGLPGPSLLPPGGHRLAVSSSSCSRLPTAEALQPQCPGAAVCREPTVLSAAWELGLLPELMFGTVGTHPRPRRAPADAHAPHRRTSRSTRMYLL